MTVRLPDGSQLGPAGTIISDSQAARRPDDAPALELSGLISDQVLDLAGGWRNAWRTEMRGPHGEWVKGMGAVAQRLGTPNGGLSREGISDKILTAWKQESDPKTRQYLNLASASWDAGDVTKATGQIRLAAAQRTMNRDYAAGGMYNKLADFIDSNWGPNGTVEANRSAMQAFLDKEAPKVPFLVGGGKEVWSGQIHTFPDTGTRLLGDLDWKGNMRVREDVAAGINEVMSHPGAPISRPQDFTVPLHELIHGVIPEDQPDRSGDMAAYQHPAEADIEEGFTELGTTQHMDQYMQQIGISARPASTRDVGGGDLIIPAGDLADQVNNPETIKEGEGWGHYPQETSAALDWVQNVAEADGRPGDYGYMTRLTDEINQQGTAGKSLTMAKQIMRTEVKGADARLTADDRSQAQILNQTRQAIIDNWKVGGSIVAAATSARQEARQSAHQIAQEKLMGERSAA
jgi:hypothetical protein